MFHKKVTKYLLWHSRRETLRAQLHYSCVIIVLHILQLKGINKLGKFQLVAKTITKSKSLENGVIFFSSYLTKHFHNPIESN